MAKTTLYMPWYPADYLSDTILLTLEEDGLYRRILDYLWLHPEGLQINLNLISMALRTNLRTIKKLKHVFDQYLVRDDSGQFYRNKRIDIERQKFEELAENKQFAAALTNQKRYGIPLAERFAKRVAERDAERKSCEGVCESPPSPTPDLSSSATLQKKEPPTPLGLDGRGTLAKVKNHKKVFEHDSDPYSLAKCFQEFHEGWARGGKPPDEPRLQAWATTFDLVLRIDHRTGDEINALLNAIDREKPGKDNFLWKHRLLSPETFRKRWNEGKLFKFIKEPEYAR